MNDNTISIGTMVASVIGLISLSITCWKFFYDRTIGNKKDRREQYHFAKDFLSEKTLNPKLHPFVLEKGYQAIVENRQIRCREIEYLLDLKDPATCLDDFILGRKYLVSLDQSSDGCICFSGRYKSEKFRSLVKYFWIGIYFLLTFLTVLPLWLSIFFKEFFTQISSVQFLTLSTLFVPGFLFYMYVALDSVQRLRRAEHLVTHQKDSLAP